MKQIAYLISLTLVLSACASTGSKTTTDENLVIELPTTPADKITRSPFFNTQKTVLKQPNGFIVEFYYGIGGRYIVLVKPPEGVFVDFGSAEGTLMVAAGEINPELISLSVDRKGIFMGTGDPRNGMVSFNLHLFVPPSRYNSSLNENIDFKIKIQDQF